MKEIYIIGHKNADIDSVAAAVAYQSFKQSSSDEIYIAASAGEIKDEIKSLLDYLYIEHPKVVNSVNTTVDDLLEDMDNHQVFISAHTTLLELGSIIRRNKQKTVPVLDETHKFLGLLTIGDIAMIYMEGLGTGQNIEKSPQILQHILNLKAADIMKTRDLVLFEKDDTIEEARRLMLSSRFRNYPVVDDENRYLGMISRYNLLEMKRKRIILVDHNEKNQAVDGVEEAEILEIIDHHRVGDVQTIWPIYFHNEPVGSTSTLVAERFLLNKTRLDKNLASLLLSGVMSDTMIFKSPTTTPKDKELARELGLISGLDPLEWGKRLFSNNDRMEKQSEQELICADLKEYVSDNIIFAISQVETVDIIKFGERRKTLLNVMNEICNREGYDLMCLMVTDIFQGGTELIATGEKSSLVEEAFKHDHKNGGIFLKGVLSRKKQVVPVIYEALRKEKTI